MIRRIIWNSLSGSATESWSRKGDNKLCVSPEGLRDDVNLCGKISLSHPGGTAGRSRYEGSNLPCHHVCDLHFHSTIYDYGKSQSVPVR